MVPSVIKKFLLIFGLALVLPFMLTMLSKPETLTFLTRAERELKLNIWFEPSGVITNTGQEVEVDVMASFESEVTLLNYIKVNFVDVEGVSILPNFIVNQRPFRGIVKIGSLSFTPLAPGSYEIAVERDNVALEVNKGDVEIQTGKINLIAK